MQKGVVGPKYIHKCQNRVLTVLPSTFCLFRGSMRRSDVREGRVHRSVQLQRKVRVRIAGHLSLQSGLHPVGQRFEVMRGGRYVDRNQTPMQAHYLRSASRGLQYSLSIDEWFHVLAKLGQVLMQTRSFHGLRKTYVSHFLIFTRIHAAFL